MLSAGEGGKSDQKREDKTVPGKDGHNPHDMDARITRIKDRLTHVAYEAEHVVYLRTDVVLIAEIYSATESNTATRVPTLGNMTCPE
jgi:hypothetical protein